MNSLPTIVLSQWTCGLLCFLVNSCFIFNSKEIMFVFTPLIFREVWRILNWRSMLFDNVQVSEILFPQSFLKKYLLRNPKVFESAIFDILIMKTYDIFFRSTKLQTMEKVRNHRAWYTYRHSFNCQLISM